MSGTMEWLSIALILNLLKNKARLILQQVQDERRDIVRLSLIVIAANLLLCFVHIKSEPCFSYDFTQYHVIDTSRQELYPHGAAHPYREFMLHVWIPITQEEQCPLILFSHGLGDIFNGMTYTQLCQYCASRGYVVASVSHTYGCKPIQLSTGKSAQYLFPAPVHHQVGKNMYDIEADMWVEDMVRALDECARQNINQESVLYNKIDMSRIGAMGHSLGGSTAMQLCRRDSRIGAAINLDGPLYGTDACAPIYQPTMFIIGSFVAPGLSIFSPIISIRDALMWSMHFNNASLPLINTFIAGQNSDVYKITIKGIVHDTFSDAGLIPDSVLTRWLIDGTLAHTIVHAYVGAFFDCYLKHHYVPLLQELVSCWPNVTVEKSNLSGVFPTIF
ncbi:MAG TPA: hypothetical protein VJJ26_03155 [Candidatus Babeliales bacterium]|nr:hypothetical protein [Candidatus Babeliales bacterium]